MSDANNSIIRFIGQGQPHTAPWIRTEDGALETDLNAYGHPARYEADDGLVAAVNTALMLNKPLLITGNPGTGKSQLAERIAWEMQIGPVLRFEAQSLSEANDLFYRFDLVGRLAESRIQSDRANRGVPVANKDHLGDSTHPARFVEFGALGKALFLAGANAKEAAEERLAVFDFLRQRAIGKLNGPRRSVVLIDEIDKASRDFPNDLLNGIDRMEFSIREVDNLLVSAPRNADRPVIIITSNQERDLPAPFLRRCAFYNIPDPDPMRLARIVYLQKFFGRSDLGDGELPPFYRQLLEFFLSFREEGAERLGYEPGTTELLDITEVLQRHEVSEGGSLASQAEAVRNSFSAVAKNRRDAEALTSYFASWKPATAA